jgi:hypothetical protein
MWRVSHESANRAVILGSLTHSWAMPSEERNFGSSLVIVAPKFVIQGSHGRPRSYRSEKSEQTGEKNSNGVRLQPRASKIRRMK